MKKQLSSVETLDSIVDSTLSKSHLYGTHSTLFQILRCLKSSSRFNNLENYDQQLVIEKCINKILYTSSVYSIIPKELREKFTSHIFIGNFKHIIDKFDDLETHHFKNSIYKLLSNSDVVLALISITLSDLFSNATYIKDENKFIECDDNTSINLNLDGLARVPTASLIGRMSNYLFIHVVSDIHKSSMIINDHIKYKSLRMVMINLSSKFIDILIEVELLGSCNLIIDKTTHSQMKKRSYLIWLGKSKLLVAKRRDIPMITEPKPWKKNELNQIYGGGYYYDDLEKPYESGFLGKKSLDRHSTILKQQKYFGDHLKSINKHQSTPFEVNSPFLDFLTKNEMKLILSNIIPSTDYSSTNFHHYYSKIQQNAIRNSGSIPNREVSLKHYQEKFTSRYEYECCIEYGSFLLNKKMYFPIMIDFRGRLYRPAKLNLQGSNITAAMTCLITNNNIQEDITCEEKLIILKSILKDSKFDSYTENEYNERFNNDLLTCEECYPFLIESLKNELLTMKQVAHLLLFVNKLYYQIPIAVDASASAYQIMSGITSDVKLASVTNLIGISSSQSNDLYELMLIYVRDEVLNEKVFKLIDIPIELVSHFKSSYNRKLAKQIIMPLVYGKKAYSYGKDIYDAYEKLGLTYKQCINLASSIRKALLKSPILYRSKCFMELMSCIGSISGKHQIPITFTSDLWESTQYYVLCEKKTYTFHTSINKKRKSRKYTLLNPVINSSTNQSEIDSRKSSGSIAANFIHFLDGHICNGIINNQMYNHKLEEREIIAPLSTVHDCFITDFKSSSNINRVYLNLIIDVNALTKLNLANMLDNILVKSNQYQFQFIVVGLRKLSKYMYEYKKNINSYEYLSYLNKLIYALERLKFTNEEKSIITLIKAIRKCIYFYRDDLILYDLIRSSNTKGVM